MQLGGGLFKAAGCSFPVHAVVMLALHWSGTPIGEAEVVGKGGLGAGRLQKEVESATLPDPIFLTCSLATPFLSLDFHQQHCWQQFKEIHCNVGGFQKGRLFLLLH